MRPRIDRTHVKGHLMTTATLPRTVTAAPDYAAIKQRQQATWGPNFRKQSSHARWISNPREFRVVLDHLIIEHAPIEQ